MTELFWFCAVLFMSFLANGHITEAAIGAALAVAGIVWLIKRA